MIFLFVDVKVQMEIDLILQLKNLAFLGIWYDRIALVSSLIDIFHYFMIDLLAVEYLKSIMF